MDPSKNRETASAAVLPNAADKDKQTETEHNLYSTEVNNVESTVCVDGGAPSVRVTLTRVSAHAM